MPLLPCGGFAVCLGSADDCESEVDAAGRGVG